MSEPYIVIDENRDINVPEELRGRIVQFDHNVETFTFQCPRYWDSRDLSTMKIFVNYVIDPKKGTCSAYLVKELNVNEADDNMTFDWVVTQDATTKEGELIIFVCAQLTDELGNLQHHWSSNFNKDFKLAKSYKCLQGIVDNYPNIIGQMLADIDKLKENGGSVTFTYNEATGDVTFGNETVLAAPEGIEAHTEIVSINGRGLQDTVAREKISELSEDIADLKGSEATGISAELTGALRTYFTNVQTILPQIAYVTEDNIGNTLIQNAKDVITVLGGGTVEPDEPIEPDNPEVTLSSISATYTGGDVATGTALSDLTGIIVTATYSDGTTKTITGYTLSGEILEGENTITVSYSGLTTTFTVTGIVESGGGEATAELPTDGLVSYFDFRTCEYNNAGSGGSTLIQPTQGNGQLFTWANNTVTEQNDYGMKLLRGFMFDENGGTTQSECGESFTWVFKCYLTSLSSTMFTNEYASFSNTSKIVYKPKYNTASSTAQVAGEGLGARLVDAYDLLILVVDKNICKLYFGNELIKEIDGNTIEGFVSWYSKLTFSIIGSNNAGYFSQLAIYNKALSDVEITEMKAYLETLEVA